MPFDEAIENIDIGGPSMLRSAAKNHERVAVVVDPDDYAAVIAELRAGGDLAGAAAAARAQGVRAHRGVRRGDRGVPVVGRRRARRPRATRRRRGASCPTRSACSGSGSTSCATARTRTRRRRSTPTRARRSRRRRAAADRSRAPRCSAASSCRTTTSSISTPRSGSASSSPSRPRSSSSTTTRAASRSTPIVAAAYQRAREADATVGVRRHRRGQPRGRRGAREAARRDVPRVRGRAGLLGGGARRAREQEEPAPGRGARHVGARRPTSSRGRCGRSPAARWSRPSITAWSISRSAKVATKRAPTDAERADLAFAWRVAKHVKSNAIVFAKDGVTRRRSAPAR